MNYNPTVDTSTLFTNPGFDRGMDSVWYYEDHQSNNVIVKKFSEGLISETMIDEFINSDNDDFYPDDFTWLYNLYQRTGTPYHNLQVIVKDKVLQEYNYIRGYHGTRVVNQETFLAQGINPFNPSSLNEQARSIFFNNIPNLSEEHFQCAISSASLYRNARAEGHEMGVNFVLNQHILVSRGCTHYLEQGSEYIQTLAGKLNQLGYRASNVLMENGAPYILVCNIPLKYIEERLLQNLISQCIYDYFLQLIEDTSNYIPQAGVTIQTGLPPELITSIIEVPMK